ncbi:MAG: msrA [Candidatus Parcubacteria bacterium]|nr:msrA [Candidatus Parcubacteria bacterium]
MENSSKKEISTKTAVFGGGCFWCTEAVFSALKGVSGVMSGYTGGTVKDPTYEDVSNGATGHIESIRINYDPAVISYGDLLAVFFNTHDPTTPNRQGNDVGTQYQSAIFYADEDQKREADALIKELNDTNAYGKPVVTLERPLGDFYEAEDYHQKYYETHKDQRYCQIIIEPKLEKLQRKFAQLVK